MSSVSDVPHSDPNTTYFSIIITHAPRWYLRCEEDLGTRYTTLFHESPDGIRARLFVPIGPSGVYVSVATAEGMMSDRLAFASGSVVVRVT